VENTASDTAASTTPAADTSAQGVDTAPVESAGVSEPQISPSDATVPDSAGQDPAAAPMDAAAARSHALIREHFGLDPAVLANASPEILSALASRAESAMFDGLLSGQKQPEAAPTPQTPQPQADNGPPTLDFEPFIAEMEAEFGETGAKAFRGALDQITKAIAPLMQMQQAFEPIAQSWHEATNAQTERRIGEFFTTLTKNEPVWADHYKNPESQKKVVETAMQFKAAAERMGHQLTGEQALTRAHLALTREYTNKQATDAVRAKVEKRSKQITTPPGMAVSSGKPTGDSPDDWRAKTLSKLKPVYEQVMADIGQ
jgi:hypothetical protein